MKFFHAVARLACLANVAMPGYFFKGAIHKGRPHQEGGGVGSPKEDKVREVAWIYSYRSSQNADKGGRGSKNPKILRTSFKYGPFPSA